MVLLHDVVARANPSRSETVPGTRESINFNVRTQLLLGRESSWTWLWHSPQSSLCYSPLSVPCSFFHLQCLLNSVVKELDSILILLTALSSTDVPTFGPQASTNNMCSLVLKEQFLMPPLGMSRFEFQQNLIILFLEYLSFIFEYLILKDLFLSWNS